MRGTEKREIAVKATELAGLARSCRKKFIYFLPGVDSATLTPTNGKSRLLTPAENFSPESLALSLNASPLDANQRTANVANCRRSKNPTDSGRHSLNAVPSLNRCNHVTQVTSWGLALSLNAHIGKSSLLKVNIASAHNRSQVGRTAYLAEASERRQVLGEPSLRSSTAHSCNRRWSEVRPYSAPISAVQRCSALFFVRANPLNLNAAA